MTYRAVLNMRSESPLYALCVADNTRPDYSSISYTGLVLRQEGVLCSNVFPLLPFLSVIRGGLQGGGGFVTSFPPSSCNEKGCLW